MTGLNVGLELLMDLIIRVPRAIMDGYGHGDIEKIQGGHVLSNFGTISRFLAFSPGDEIGLSPLGSARTKEHNKE
jgi:hypothetical protein